MFKKWALNTMEKSRASKILALIIDVAIGIIHPSWFS